MTRVPSHLSDAIKNNFAVSNHPQKIFIKPTLFLLPFGCKLSANAFASPIYDHKVADSILPHSIDIHGLVGDRPVTNNLTSIEKKHVLTEDHQKSFTGIHRSRKRNDLERQWAVLNGDQIGWRNNQWRKVSPYQNGLSSRQYRPLTLVGGYSAPDETANPTPPFRKGLCGD